MWGAVRWVGGVLGFQRRRPGVSAFGLFTQVSAGYSHACGVRSDGSVVCWGSNREGQAEAPSGLFTQVSAGGNHSCGVRSDGSVVCWGLNRYGQAVAPSGSFTQVSAGGGQSYSAGGNHSCGVRSDGSVVCWGFNRYGQAVAPSGSFTQVSAGGNHSCGVRSDGSVVCWGGAEAVQAAPSGSFTQVSAGGGHACGVRSDGSVVCWGFNRHGQAEPPSGSFTQVSAGGIHSCGVRSDGSVACWGASNALWAVWQLAPSGSFTQVSAGGYHSCGVRSDGSVVCWGTNLKGQAEAPSGSFTQVSSAGGNNSHVRGGHSCGVRSDGSVVCWGRNEEGQAVAPSGSFTQVSAGGDHSCGVRSDGSVVCWGFKVHGQAEPPSGSFTQVSAGGNHSCGVRSDGSVVCWGYNRHGQAAAPWGSFTKVSAGGDHSCGLRSDGSVVCWGYNRHGQAAAPWGSFTKVSAGGDHSCGLRSDGSVVCWGYNGGGQVTAPSGSFTQVSAGNSHSCGVRSDGSVVCWGNPSVFWPAVSDGGGGLDPVESVSVPGKVALPSVTVGDGSLGVSWDAPVDGGSPIVDYDVRHVESGYIGCADCGPLPWVEWEPSAVSTSRRATITGLANGTSYAVVVRAKNSVGVGEWSDDEWGAPVGAALGAPRGLSAAADGVRGLRLSWSAPAANGGSAIDHYRVEISRGPLQNHPVHSDRDEWSSGVFRVNRTDYHHPRLLAGVTYTILVRGVNAAGANGPHASATATTTAPVAFSAPRGLSAAADGVRGLRVRWSAPAANGGSAIEHYRVEISRGPLQNHPVHGDEEKWSRVFRVNRTEFHHPRLLTDVTYTVSVTAVNKAGSRSPTATATATTTAQSGTTEEEPFTLEQVKITDMEQLKPSLSGLIPGVDNKRDSVRVKWKKVNGATGYEIAFWYRKPAGDTTTVPDIITVQKLAERTKLECETPGKPDGLPCGPDVDLDNEFLRGQVSGANTTEYLHPHEFDRDKIPGRLEVAVRAVNSNAKGDWSKPYSLPAKECGNTDLGLSELGAATTIAEFWGWRIDIAGRAELLKFINRAILAADILNGLNSVYRGCKSFKDTAADLIIDSIPFIRNLFNSVVKAFDDLKCKDRTTTERFNLGLLGGGFENHPRKTSYIMCGSLYDIKGEFDADYKPYKLN